MLIDGYFGGTNRHLFIEISELFFSVQILQLLIQLVQRTLHPLHSAQPGILVAYDACQSYEQ